MRIPRAKLAALDDYRDSDLFDDLEKTVLEFASRLTSNPAEVPPELFEELTASLGDAQVVQLAGAVALENFLGRFNRGIGLEAQGYASGGSCLVPGSAGGPGSGPENPDG